MCWFELRGLYSHLETGYHFLASEDHCKPARPTLPDHQVTCSFLTNTAHYENLILYLKSWQKDLKVYFRKNLERTLITRYLIHSLYPLINSKTQLYLQMHVFMNVKKREDVSIKHIKPTHLSTVLPFNANKITKHINIY